MADNNKTPIGIKLDNEAEKSVEQYTQALDNLRNSINSLSQPFNSFTNSLSILDKNLSKYTDSLNKLNDQNEAITITADKAQNKITELSTSFVTWNRILETLKISIGGWTSALTGGLSIIIAFLPEIIKFTTALFKGKEAANAMSTNFKNLNDVMKASNTEAASQITALQVLYKSATDVNNTYANRLKSVKQLKQEYPDLLKGLRDEDILNGKVKNTYKNSPNQLLIMPGQRLRLIK